MTSAKSTPHVLIIGGYGEFGGRLAKLLQRDGMSVVIAGRDFNKARKFCRANGGTPLKLDITTDLILIETLDVDVVVDAAGPFQSYGQDQQRYHLARRTLECGAHYLDLSDDGKFSSGISCLDTLAKQQQRFALSGASSTPALSGAVVTALQENLCSIEKIETSILPGSRAPQGQSVMSAILDQVGNPVSFWRDGAWEEHIGWSTPVRKRINDTLCRNANLINAADAVLFPKHFNARSVIFRAGLAMPIMHLSLQWLGALRSYGLLPNLTKFIAPLRWCANRLVAFGSDHGGMLVEVIGKRKSASTLNDGQLHELSAIESATEETLSNDSHLVSSTWCLSAEPGQGPFIPTIAIRAILRNIHQVPSGARACIGELPLQKYAQAMDDLGVHTHSHTQALNYLFADVLGEQWHTLPEAVRNTHSVIDKKTLKGFAKITRGSSWVTKLIAAVFRFPASADKVSVEVTKTRSANSEVWVRNFNGQKFKSTLSSVAEFRLQSTDQCIREQFGLLKFVLGLNADSSGLHFPVVSGSCIGIPIPKVFLPASNTREFEKDGTMHFCVELLAPFKLGLIVRYEGWLT